MTSTYKTSLLGLGRVGLVLALLGASVASAAGQSMQRGSAMDRSSHGMASGTAQEVAPKAVVGPVTGQALVEHLRQGGLILWMRHGARDDRPGEVTDAQAAAHNCAQQSQLTAKGQTQARAVGAGMRALNLPIARVNAARLCRTETTARLLNVGPVHTEARLDAASTWKDRGGDAAYENAIAALLSNAPPPGKDVVDVTSKLTTAHPEPAVLAALSPGEVAVFAPDPDGPPRLLARIGRRAWPELARESGSSSQ
ncbi:histidine phosphatase family protein [Salinisphaera hydrothermalis]|uniref:Phosphoglycerate mutase n=1 Tax=Salinisphaera hydrothermalis (strain C41B8) TaxID=1304275 RepID=A0A084IH42_SALHC|nr:histidine phosphatase family protein [Salinisphaera hydrothermalis]KEZ76026.1 hypothetical protein C41B8_17059 [Salinisphaera hydrothermalis C41B8]